ncbi:hypothetical protein [Yokenella regensburgei]
MGLNRSNEDPGRSLRFPVWVV